MGERKENEKKMVGHRKAIKEHIDKYYRYRMFPRAVKSPRDSVVL